MAWGCFCWVPCPYKRWNEDDRTAMVAMLPLVGTGLGLLTGLVWAAVCAFQPQPVLAGAVVTGVYFVMTGFIHLDGFMDVSDAVMPRHPDLQERRRILKDPHTGSFAAVSMALMFLIFAGSAAELSGQFAKGALAFIAIMTTSRAMSAVTVITSRPMETSQYINTEFGTKGTFSKAIPALVILALVLAACAAICLNGPVVFGTGARWMPGMGGTALWILISSAVCAATALLIAALDRKALGGMNGDISGHMITSGEMAGLLAAALLAG